jgi:nitroreductase
MYRTRKENTMDFQELIEKRYSVRAYTSDPVPEDMLEKVLRAARLAPTAANRQAFKVIVLRTDTARESLLKIYRSQWFVQPPIVIGVVGCPSESWVRGDNRNYVDVDAAIVMDHIVMAATDLGLGTCWIGAFDPGQARDVLGLPPDVEPLVFTPLGFPADEPKEKKRKPLAELVRYGTWE